MQPIDLQTLFTQMDKVAKTQSQMKEGLQIQATMQQVQSQKKAEEQVRSINETQDMGYGVSQIKDEKSHKDTPGHNHQNEDSENTESDETQTENKNKNYFRDPTLGRNIDISG